MNPALGLPRDSDELFNFATVTHYNYDTWYPVFEPFEEEHRFGVKDEIVGWLKEHNVAIGGRPLFWFHPSVMPDWLREKNFDELKDYVRRHTGAVVGHYGDDIRQWEVVNERTSSGTRPIRSTRSPGSPARPRARGIRTSRGSSSTADPSGSTRRGGTRRAR